MGKKDELPFCTICRESDKRDNKNADARREAMRTTQDIYNGFLERIEAARARGSVERYATDPGAFVVRLSAEVNATVLQPIVRQRSSFRKLTRTRGFAQCERVLQIGSLNGGVTPYLAESAAVVTVVDFRRSALDRIQGIAHALGFDNVKVTLIQSAAALPFDDASFDGIWLNGRLLTLAGRRLVLSEARRLLAPGGRVSAVQCLGPGGVIEQVANGRLGAADAAAAFAGGVAFDRRGSFMTSITVLAALKGSGLVSDRERPPAGTRFDGDPGAPNLRTDFADLARYLEPGNRPAGFFNKTEALHGVERFVAFTATKEEPAERARNSH
jgi:SAM-dependent methyltransferase